MGKVLYEVYDISFIKSLAEAKDYTDAELEELIQKETKLICKVDYAESFPRQGDTILCEAVSYHVQKVEHKIFQHHVEVYVYVITV